MSLSELGPVLAVTLTLALGCATDGPLDDADPDLDGERIALESGQFSVMNAELSNNSCGANLSMFFPLTLTMTVADDAITVDELDAHGSHGDGAFSVEAMATTSYREDRLSCSLDFRTRFDGIVLTADEAEVELQARISAAAGTDNADCARAATEVLGLASWAELGGCRVDGAFLLSRE